VTSEVLQQRADVEQAIKGRTLCDQLRDTAGQHGDAPAYSDRPALDAPWETLTWAQTRQMALELAAGYAELGLAPGEWVALMMPNRVEHVLADPRFADYGRQATSIGRYAPEVKYIWEDAFKGRARDEIIALIKSIGGDAVPMMDYPSLLSHAQVEALSVIIEVPHPNGGTFKTIRPVARFTGAPESVMTAPPKLGQHTQEVLLSLKAEGN